MTVVEAFCVEGQARHDLTSSLGNTIVAGMLIIFRYYRRCSPWTGAGSAKVWRRS